jgi:peptidoglycan/LPS O-acetylase OafA/YrhL
MASLTDTKQLAYRADIDGLRALSVVAVILFHFSVPGFSGGFIGVDVFFVISGYLITQLLVLHSHQPFRRWLVEFYARRARRILPALLLVLLVSAGVAWWLFAPQELTSFGKWLALSVVMLANHAARETGGYFDTPWTSTPLQHLWSIAVEEQFYLAYPLTLFLILRFAPSAKRGLLAIGVLASFVLCVWASTAHPIGNYYYALTRAWELGAGALLSLCALRWAAPRAVRELLAAAALAAIVVPAVCYDSLTPFPGWYALPVCLGAVTLIATGSVGGSVVNSLLALPPLAFVGLISYALYLWHMPLKVFWDYYMVRPPGRLELLAQLALLVVIAIASWKWLEVPLRRRRWVPSNRIFLVTQGVIAATLFAFGYRVWHSDGLPQRLPPEERRLVEAARFTDQAVLSCLPPPMNRVAVGDLCRFGAADSPRDVVLLWGDSHALMLLPAVRAIAQRHGMQAQFAGRSNCPPIIGSPIVSSPDEQQRCEAFNVAMTDAIAQIRPHIVILAGFWGDPEYRPSGTATLGDSALYAAFSRNLQQTVDRIRADGRTLCLVRDVPTFRFGVTHSLAMAHRRGIEPVFNLLTLNDARHQQSPFDSAFDQLESQGLFVSVNLRERLCAPGSCRMLDEAGLPVYSDNNHLTRAGARIVEPVIEGCFHDPPQELSSRTPHIVG